MQQNTLPTPTITTKPRAHEHINFKRMRAWSYFRRELLYITWALMEVALIVPVSLAVMQWATWSPTTVAFGVLGVMLIPFYLARLMTWLKLPLRLQQQIMIGIALFTILWSIRSINYEMESAFDFSWISQFFTNLTVANSNLWQHDLGLFGLITLAWWRGTLLVSRTLDVVKFGLRFRRSSLYFAPLIILLAYFQLDWSILPFILLFFLAGLTAVTLTRAEQAELEQKAIIAAISPRWLTTVFSFSLGITLLASGISRFISGNFSGIFSLFTPVWQALRIGSISTGLTMLYLISPLLDVFNAILEAIIAFWKWAFSRLFIPVDDPQTENTQEAVQDGFQRYLLEQQQIGSDPLVNWRIVLLIMLILALIAAVYALGRYYNKNKVTVENGRFGRIVDTFVSQLAQIRRKKEKKEEAAFDWKTAVTIQRIYAKMSHTAADLGHPRGEAETPYEYLSALHMLWPEHKPEIQTITTAYVKVHYGELPANKEEFNQIEQAWHHIETISEEIAITRK